MNEEIRNKFRKAEPIILTIAFIAIVFFLYTVYAGDGAQCLANPLVYGVADISGANDDTLTCQCGFIKNTDTILEVTSEKLSIRDRNEVHLLYN